MKFIFLSIEGDANHYVEQKLKTLVAYTRAEAGNVSGLPDATLNNAARHIGKTQPRIASAEEYFKVTAAQQRVVEISQRCALMELAADAPLVEGETIVEDFFSYLLEPFEDMPAYTAVLRRKTNMAEMLYFFSLVAIDNGKLVHLDAPEPNVPMVKPRLRGGSIMLSKELIKKLLKKAGTTALSGGLSHLGSFIVGLVIKELFGDDNERMIAEIKKIVKDEVEGNELARVEGVVYGTLQFFATEYKNLKAGANLSDVNDRKMLLAKLDKFNTDFYPVLGFLRSEKYAIRGLKTFMLAAPVHLILTQEMAMVDPDVKAIADPNKSTYRQTLRDNATLYRKHVEASFNKAINDRNRMEVFNKPFVDCAGSSCVSKNMVMWRDHVSGEEAGEFMDTKDPKKTAWERASASLEEHRTAVLKKLTEDLGDPRNTFLADIGALESFTFPTAPQGGMRLAKAAPVKAAAKKAAAKKAK